MGKASLLASLGGALLLTAVFAVPAVAEEKAPETSTTTTTTTTTSPPAPVSPTEKAPRIDPQAPNQFTPPVLAPPPSQVQPGEHGRHVTNGS